MLGDTPASRPKRAAGEPTKIRGGKVIRAMNALLADAAHVFAYAPPAVALPRFRCQLAQRCLQARALRLMAGPAAETVNPHVMPGLGRLADQ